MKNLKGKKIGRLTVRRFSRRERYKEGIVDGLIWKRASMITYYRGSADRRVYAIFNELFGTVVVDFEHPEKIRVIAHDDLWSKIPFVRLQQPREQSKLRSP